MVVPQLLWTCIYVLTAALALLFFYIKRTSVPQPPGSPPRFNYLWSALSGKFDMKKTGPVNMIKEGYKKHGELFSLKVFNETVTCMIGPEAQAAFHSLRDDQAEQRSVYRFTIPVFGPGIAYDAEPKRMAEQLRFLKYGLDGEPMKRHGIKIVKEIEEFFGNWRDCTATKSKTVQLHQTMSELIINTASRTLMGSEVRNKLHTRFADLYQTLSDGMTHLTVAFPYAPVPLHRARDNARKEIVTLFKQVIQTKRALVASGETLDPDEDMINFLMSQNYKNKEPISDDDICGLLLATLFAGQHTSTITATWCLLEVIRNKPLIARLMKEQEAVLRQTDGELTYEALNDMELMTACIKETLRKYPPLIALLRRLCDDYKYKGFTIPAGNIVAMLPAVGHKLDDIFPEPEKFDPDRFYAPPDQEPENHETKANAPLNKWDQEDLKRKWVPFGGGIHKCLGFRFGLMQTTAIVSTLIRNFDIEPVDPIPGVDYSHLVAGPHHPTRVKFTRKEKPLAFGQAANTQQTAQTVQEAPAPAPAVGQPNAIMTKEELAKHNTKDDCFVAIHGKVYNLTNFLPKHPGGTERVMPYAGGDATFAFENQQHSKKARMWMKAFQVAELAQ